MYASNPHTDKGSDSCKKNCINQIFKINQYKP